MRGAGFVGSGLWLIAIASPLHAASAPFDELETLAAAGFTGLAETDLRVELPVPDADTLWRWFQTHGSRKFFDDLPAERRAEFRARLIDDLNGRAHLVLRRYAWLFTGRT